MPKLPPVTVRQFIKFLQQHGFIIDRQSGSHIILKKSGVENVIAIPNHNKGVSIGVVMQSLKTANITRDEFITAMQQPKKSKQQK